MDLEHNVKKLIGDRIRSARTKKGWSQEELAHRADLHPSHMGQIERGETAFTIDSLEKVINALDMTFEELFRFIGTEHKDVDTEALAYIINRLYRRDSSDLKVIARFIDTMIEWKDK